MDSRAQWTLVPSLAILGMMLTAVAVQFAASYAPSQAFDPPKLQIQDGSGVIVSVPVSNEPTLAFWAAALGVAVGLSVLMAIAFTFLQQWYGGPTVQSLVSVITGPALAGFGWWGLISLSDGRVGFIEHMLYAVIIGAPILVALLMFQRARQEMPLLPAAPI